MTKGLCAKWGFEGFYVRHLGIVGARGTAPPEREGIERATRALRHRGPDGFGFHFDEAVAFGHTRLSIIDVEHGEQPLWNEDGTVMTIYNGEIWNYPSFGASWRIMGTFSAPGPTQKCLCTDTRSGATTSCCT